MFYFSIDFPFLLCYDERVKTYFDAYDTQICVYFKVLVGGDGMDIAALSFSMSTSRASSNMGIALLSKVLDTAEVTGEAINEMIESASVTVPGLGEYLDIRV